MGKKIVAALIVLIAASCVAAYAQDKKTRAINGDESIAHYEQERLEQLPTFQAVRRTSDGFILRAADCVGFGMEVFGGGDYSLRADYYTPRGGVNVRYDGKKTSYRLGASVINREYNEEADRAGQRYLAYAATAGLNINLFTSRNRVHVFALYAEGGYLFGKHSYKVGEEEIPDDAEMVIIKAVKHNGSGLVYGGGLEYRCQFFGSGNALTVRVGYQDALTTFVNNTRKSGLVGAQLGFNFGIHRCRVRAK